MQLRIWEDKLKSGINERTLDTVVRVLNQKFSGNFVLRKLQDGIRYGVKRMIDGKDKQSREFGLALTVSGAVLSAVYLEEVYYRFDYRENPRNYWGQNGLEVGSAGYLNDMTERVFRARLAWNTGFATGIKDDFSVILTSVAADLGRVDDPRL